MRDKKRLVEVDDFATKSGAHNDLDEKIFTSIVIADTQMQSCDPVAKILKPLGYDISGVTSRDELFEKIQLVRECTLVLTEPFVLQSVAISSASSVEKKANGSSLVKKELMSLVSDIKKVSPAAGIIFAANKEDKKVAVELFDVGISDYWARDKDSDKFTSQLTESLNKIKQRKVFLSRQRLMLNPKKQLPSESNTFSKLEDANVSLSWLSAAPGCAMIVTPELKILGLNNQCEKFFGYLPNELTHRSLSWLLPRKIFSELIERTNANTDFPRDIQGNTVTELVAKKADGSAVPVRCLIKKIELDEQQVGYILNIEDISRSISAKAESIYFEKWQQLITDYSQKFITLPVDKFQNVIEQLLEEGGLLVACQRVTIYQVSESLDRAQLVFEWLETKCKSLKTYSERIDFSSKMQEVNLLLGGEKQILFPRKKVKLTELNLSLGLSEHLAEVNSYSSYVIPMLNRDKVFAWLGFDFQYAERCWQQTEIERLDSLANLVNQALLRKKYEEIRRLTHIKLIETHGRLSKQACIDGLTKLANRRYFDRILEAEIRRAARDKNCLSVLLCDVDYFKRYNDQYGHIAGDICLKTVSRNFEESFQRAGDFVARYGGEEFAVILPGLDCKSAFNAADKMRQRLFDLQVPHKDSPLKVISISVGLTCIRAPSIDQQEFILRRADKALYRAKNKGRNRVFVYDRLRKAH